MLPAAGDQSVSRAPTQPVFARQPSAASVAPPSTAIRSRFHALTQTGTKRPLDDASPSRPGGPSGPAPWMLSHETPLRQTGRALLDDLLPQRLFSPAGSSPARSLLASASKQRADVGHVESLRRMADRARFEVQQVEAERAKEREEALRGRQALERELLAVRRRVETLERDRRWLADQEEREAEGRRDADKRVAKLKAHYEARMEDLAARAAAVQQTADAADERARRMAAEHAQEKEALHARLAQAERAAAGKADTPADDVALRRRVAELEHALAERPAADSSETPGRVAQLERDVREQCAYISALEQHVQRLRDPARRQSASAGREHEEVRGLRAKVRRLEAQLADTAEMQAQLGVLRQERDQWADVFARGKDGVGSPYAAAHVVAEQRQALQALEARVGVLQDAADTARGELERSAQQLQASELARRTLEDALAAERQKAARAETARAHATREAAFLRDQLQAYEREAAVLSPAHDKAAAARIAQMERFIDEQRTWIETEASEKPAEPQLPGELLRGYREDAEAARKELDGAREENARLVRQLEALEREAAHLEHQVGAGLGYNPRTTRILQLIDNPSARDFAIRSSKLAALSSENAALLERIRQLESTQPQEHVEADSQASPFFHTIDILRSENSDLRQQLESSSKLISRYKTEWKRKAAEMREVVYLILGYRVDFLPNGSVRFTSMYAADADQNFVFTSGAGNEGIMSLSGGGSKSFLKGLSNDIRYWVQEQGSIPGFMAHITMHSFEEVGKSSF
ncbi:coiled-coil domain-containing protein mad1 [Coemansia erecta]|uniref:Spindle assembly checkpoint component MAD1 n=1 Tax=Coemansia erecta TaxID=147472 RepID=A0A9W7Y2D4_9FUNG|nr:coiled-coil domain-containing protein mad1 [Coemansia erecta]